MTETRVRLLLGLAPPDEHALEQLLYTDEQLLVVAAGANASELLAVAHEQTADLVLISADLPGIDAGTVARLRALGLRTIGVALDASAAATLPTLDPDVVLEPPIAVADLVGPPHESSGGRSSSTRASADASAEAARGENVLAVVGSKGSPGASELALSFAALAGTHGGVLLAELDGDGGALALRAGADPQAGSVLGVARALRRGDQELEQLLPGWLAGGERGWPQVLLGPPELLPPRELGDPGVIHDVIDFLAARFELVVCDVGQRLHHSGQPDLAVRLHRDTLVRADAVVLVLGARPDQLQSGFRQLELLLDDLGVAGERLRIVVNAQPAAAAGAETAAAISQALDDRQLTVDAWLPWEARAARAALRVGQPLALARPRGRYARAVRRLVESLLLAPSEAVQAVAPAAASAAQSREVALPWR
jgi:MinD-like ATPase involved in chromosome partitioning or flagellar assembly